MLKGNEPREREKVEQLLAKIAESINPGGANPYMTWDDLRINLDRLLALGYISTTQRHLMDEHIEQIKIKKSRIWIVYPNGNGLQLIAFAGLLEMMMDYLL